MPRILLLEDSPSLNRLLCFTLESAGHEVYCETHSADALNYRGTMPDLIGLDVLMPGLDGPTVLAGLIERGFNGKVIVISGLETSERLSRLMGADAFLLKPFAPEDLLRTVDAVLAINSSHKWVERSGNQRPLQR